MKLTKEEFEQVLLNNYESDVKILEVVEADAHVEDGVLRPQWTVADLYIRQWLNNGCNGFGLTNVGDIYDLCVSQKEDLIKWGWVNKDAYNNFGFPLWHDYNF